MNEPSEAMPVAREGTLPRASSAMRRESIVALLAVLAAIVGATLVNRDAAFAFWRGSVGSLDAITSGTLVRAIPLMFTGVAVSIAFRAGVLNIGAEGQLLMGAMASTALAVHGGDAPRLVLLPMVLIAGAAAGAAWAGVAALLRVRFGVLEVISTILLNFLAVQVVGYAVRGPLQESSHIFPQSATLPAAAQLHPLWESTRLHGGLLIVAAVAAAAWWMIWRTEAGFRLRVVGANPDAARSAGRIDVSSVTSRAMLWSGAVAGLAGAVEVTGVTRTLYENISPGYGYTGIAVALLARLDPIGVLASGALFGALDAGAAAAQRDAGVPSEISSVVQGVIILVLVVMWRARRGGDGPTDKSAARLTGEPARDA